MHKIIVEQECGCFKRSDLENYVEHTSKEDALIQALNMKTTMSSDFCGKHDFQVVEEASNFVISMVQEQAHSGCCGGGCH